MKTKKKKPFRTPMTSLQLSLCSDASWRISAFLSYNDIA